MTQPTVTLAPVVVDVTVRVPLEKAFAAFTADFDRWWPKHSHHIGKTDPEVVVLEPRAGGRWFERGTDGVECDWGVVTAWDPPHRLELAWGLDGSYTYVPGPEHASRVAVAFTALEPGLTRVVVTHDRFDAHAATAADVHGSVGSPGGWPLLTELFRAVAEG